MQNENKQLIFELLAFFSAVFATVIVVAIRDYRLMQICQSRLPWTTDLSGTLVNLDEGSIPADNNRTWLFNDLIEKGQTEPPTSESFLIFPVNLLQLGNIFSPKPRGMKFILFSQEALPQVFPPIMGIDSFVDGTITYMQISDIPRPYGYFERKERTRYMDEEEKRHLLSKKGLIFWVASKCTTHSGREWYVRELQKYLPVDVYGNCGDLQLANGKVDEIARKYKFRIAFENSVCNNYTTERFYEALKQRTVPVVLRRNGLPANTPNGSYIAAEDFDSARSLAKHIIQLSQNDQSYLAYFEWSQRWSVHLMHPCANLKPKTMRNFKQSNLYSAWTTFENCQFQYAKSIL